MAPNRRWTAGSGELTALTVTPIIEGKGPAATAGQTISVNYVGVSYKTGEEFDASWSGSEPFSFQLGGGNVIKGWDQGLVGVKVGSRFSLTFHPTSHTATTRPAALPLVRSVSCLTSFPPSSPRARVNPPDSPR